MSIGSLNDEIINNLLSNGNSRPPNANSLSGSKSSTTNNNEYDEFEEDLSDEEDDEGEDEEEERAEGDDEISAEFDQDVDVLQDVEENEKMGYSMISGNL